MDQRETPCTHCKAKVVYPAADIGMPVTCKSCGLSFDAPDGRPARIVPVTEMQTACPKCQGVLAYLPEAAGRVVACPSCAVKIKLPGGPDDVPKVSLEFAEKEEDQPRPVKKSQGTVIRGKKGFGRAIVGPHMAGPRMTVERDPAAAKKLISLVILIVVGVALAAGLYALYNHQIKITVDRKELIRAAAKQYIEFVNYDNVDGLVELCGATPENRAERAREYREIFAKIQVRIDEYKIKDVFEKDNSGGVALIDWSYKVKDLKNGKIESFPNKGGQIDLRYRDGRFTVNHPWIFPRGVRD